MKIKVCNRCFKDKPLSEFHKDKTRKDGLQWALASGSWESVAYNIREELKGTENETI